MSGTNPYTQKTFRGRAEEALQDKQLRGNFRRAMDGLMSKRADAFQDPEEWNALRSLGEATRKKTLSKLPELLEQLEANLTKNGIQVHWAQTTDEANKIVLEICQRRQAKAVIKGKSMVSEEMELNHFLEENGIEALESDLGEYIIQLAGQTPSHIVVPAIHLNTKQIAELFHDKVEGCDYHEDAEILCKVARDVMRRKFAEADVGISGVNMAIAETGTLLLVENEGNGRMSTTAPPVHVAVMGIEKVVETLEDAAPILSLLPRSATGQPITTYVNMISSPRKEGELDGPEEVHVVLLDNGRSAIFNDDELKQTLQCIRCAACMNHCPVYGRVGGHAYGGVYPGPIGKILTPQLTSMEEAGDLAFGSTLCNACVEVCPVKIPIVDVLLRLRSEANLPKNMPKALKDSGVKRGFIEAATWKLWQKGHQTGSSYNALSAMLGMFGNMAPGSADPMKEWTKVRTKPKFAGESLHKLAKKEGFSDD